MSERQFVTTDEIEKYQELLKEQGINAVSGIYTALANKGFAYASWADGVATGSTITGQAALSYMGVSAGRTFTQQETDNIRVSMQDGYLRALLAQTNNPSNSTNQDVNFETTRNFHKEAFEKNGLTIGNWTLETPMVLINHYLGGTPAQEKAWEEVRETGGVYVSSWLSSTNLLSITLDAMKGFFIIDKEGNYIPAIALDENRKDDYTIVPISKEDIIASEHWIATTKVVTPTFTGALNSIFGGYDVSIIGDQDNNSYDDTIYSAKAVNYPEFLVSHIYGLTGNDTLRGWVGTDHLYGGTGNDKLYGDDKDDYLNGGMGDDILYGGKDNDILVGGTGFDTYILEGNDTIIDSDGLGKIQYSDGKTIPTLMQMGKTDWTATDGTTTYMAHQQINDLIITQTEQDGKTNVTTIKEFFVNAKTDSTGNISGLEITLNHNAENKTNLYTNPDKVANIYTGGLNSDTPVAIISSKQGDNIFGSGNIALDIHAQGGNDQIFGSSKADLIYGEDGNDVIYGSSAYLETQPVTAQPQADNDIIYGGAGTDLLFGGVGNDVIYANEATTHLITNSKNEKGDWVMGGIGNDRLYGSENNDFLQGGRDMDFVYGGAGDDVILGDSNIRFGVLSKTIYNISYDEIGIQPTDSMHPLIPPGYSPIITTPSTNTLSIDYMVTNNAWSPKNLESVYYRDKSTFEWQVAIDTTKNDYTLTTPVALASNESAVNSDHASDFLYGSFGNDLIIGQYGDDALYGNEGNDILYGDDNRNLEITGNDWLEAGSGADKLFGGKGSDTYAFSTADLYSPNDVKTIKDIDNSGRIMLNGIDLSTVIFTQDKDDKNVYANTELNLIVTHMGNEYEIKNYGGVQFAGIINIQETSDKPLGLQLQEAKYNQDPTPTPEPTPATDPTQGTNGDDTFVSTQADETFNGLKGIDTLNYSSQAEGINVILYGEQAFGNSIGNDRLISIENIIATQYNDHILGNSSDNTFHGKAGDDLLDGAEGNDILNGEQGDDKLYGIAGNDLLNGGIGNDTLFGGIGEDTLNGEAGDDSLEGDAGNDVLNGGAGNDILRGWDDNDILEGDTGNDTLVGGNGDDKLIAGEGEDALFADNGNDILNGGLGADILQGGQGNDDYIFDADFGFDSVLDCDTTVDNTDTLTFTSLNISELNFERVGDNLKISQNNRGDNTIYVNNWYKDNGAYVIENWKMADGSSFDATAIMARVI